jgi:uncharacterized protein YciW
MRGVDPIRRGDAIRARVPEVLRMYSETRRNILAGGILDAEIKELCARYLAEDPELGEFDDPGAFDERQRAALAWARAIAWDPSLADDALWERLHEQFTEPELVELGYCMAIVHGQLHWLRTLGLSPERHEALAF